MYFPQFVCFGIGKTRKVSEQKLRTKSHVGGGGGAAAFKMPLCLECQYKRLLYPFASVAMIVPFWLKYQFYEIYGAGI